MQHDLKQGVSRQRMVKGRSPFLDAILLTRVVPWFKGNHLVTTVCISQKVVSEDGPQTLYNYTLR